MGNVYTGKQSGIYIIAVDFDGTLTEFGFPDVGKRRDDVIAALLQRKKQLELEGYTDIVFILWTCREGHYLDAAKEWCALNFPEIRYYNENPIFEKNTGVRTRKIYADEYWDDKCVKV